MKNKIKTITALFALGAIILCGNAFANAIGYSWANPSLCPTVSGACNKTAIPNAGTDKSYCPACPSTITLGGGSPNFCNGGTNACGPCQMTYAWTPTTGLSCTTCCNPIASPASTTTYTLSVTYACGHATTCPGGGGPYDCCLDACDGLNRTCTGPTYCAGSPVYTDVVIVTVISCSPCRIANPEKQPEIIGINTKIYPNPSPGIFTLELGEILPGSSIVIYNMEGDAIWTEADIQISKRTIDLSDQKKGMYFIEVRSNNKTAFYKKIIIQ